MASTGAEKQLCRSRDAYIGGVCAGIAERFDFDPIVIRIMAILLAGLTVGLGILVYLVLWAALPRQDEPPAPYDVMPESAESSSRGFMDRANDPDGDARHEGLPILARLAVAVGLMLLFLLVSINLSPLVPGTRWWQFWPLGLLIVGLCLIIIPIRTRLEAAWHALGIVITSVSASVLPMSLGIVSWGTIPHTLATMWPIALLAVCLFALGMYRNVDALILAGAFCFVALCLLGSMFCVLPGELDVLLLHMPSGHSITIGLP